MEQCINRIHWTIWLEAIDFSAIQMCPINFRFSSKQQMSIRFRAVLYAYRIQNKTKSFHFKKKVTYYICYMLMSFRRILLSAYRSSHLNHKTVFVSILRVIYPSSRNIPRGIYPFTNAKIFVNIWRHS